MTTSRPTPAAPPSPARRPPAPIEEALESEEALDQGQYLTFMLGGETFALGILAIKEIIQFQRLTVVPMMPDTVRGVLNLRGAVVPVIDLSARFGRGPSEVKKATCIVIVETGRLEDRPEGRRVVGVIVDAVNQVLEIPASDIEPPPSFGASIPRGFIQGLGKVNGKFVILLAADEVLALDEVAEVSEEPKHSTVMTGAGATSTTASVSASDGT